MRTDSAPRCRVRCVSQAGLFLFIFPFLGHPNMGGPMRMNPPRGMAMGPQVRQRPDAIVTDEHFAAVVPLQLSDQRCTVLEGGGGKQQAHS